jgi:hypothetical protein
MRKISILIVFFSFALPALAFAVTLQQLFVIERSKNANIVIYEARLDDAGALLSDSPVIAYWKLNATTGKKEALSMLDKKAYGFSIKKEGDRYQMTLAAFKKRPIKIIIDGNTVRAQITINGIQSWLTKVYVKAKDNGVIPKVDYLELFGAGVDGENKTYEKLLP